MSTPYPQQPEQQSSGPYAPAQPSPQGYAVVSQGYTPGYAPVTQGPVTQKVNRVSIILGVVGWALIGLTSQRIRPRPEWQGSDRILAALCADVYWPGEPRRWCYRDRWGSGEAEDAEAQLAGNPPEREPIRRLHRLHDRSDGVHVGH